MLFFFLTKEMKYGKVFSLMNHFSNKIVMHMYSSSLHNIVFNTMDFN